jgi:hypothetical protein
VTAWETFVEDTLRAQFLERLDRAASPNDIFKAFNHAAAEWFKQSPKDPRMLATWTGTGWKSHVQEHHARTIASLSNPNAKLTASLFKRFLDTDVTAAWQWGRVTPAIARQRLDSLLEHRGRLAHRGRSVLSRKAEVRRRQVDQYVGLVKQLVARTESALGIGPRDIS